MIDERDDSKEEYKAVEIFEEALRVLLTHFI